MREDGWLLLLLLPLAAAVDIDPRGYVVYCPCMGRFGNQMDQHLGAFEFAAHLGRTLVLPPFVSFERGTARATMIPFEDVFQLEPIRRAWKIVTVADFHRDVMPTIWPKKKRKAFCWNARSSLYEKGAAPSCNAKEGNPFGPFWDYIGVDSFTEDVYFGAQTGGWDTTRLEVREAWKKNFPPSDFPVLAFTGAPSAFPAYSATWKNQQHFRWNSRIISKAKAFVQNHLTKPFVGIHLRNDIDWERVCEHVDPTQHLFASPQCLGEVIGEQKLTKDICSPSTQTIMDQVVDEVGRNGAKSVFVASDKDHMIDEINDALSAYEVRAFRQNSDDAFVSLAILEMADHFIGNCVSTFSAVAYRSRLYKWRRPRPSSFFGMPLKTEGAKTLGQHTDL